MIVHPLDLHVGLHEVCHTHEEVMDLGYCWVTVTAKTIAEATKTLIIDSAPI